MIRRHWAGRGKWSYIRLGRPAPEAVVEGLPRTVDGGCVNPAPSALDDMDDAPDHPPVSHARLATGVGGKLRSQLRELLVGQPETISIRRRPPFGGRGSYQAA